MTHDPTVGFGQEAALMSNKGNAPTTPEDWQRAVDLGGAVLCLEAPRSKGS
jgi:hypothetical protein